MSKPVTLQLAAADKLLLAAAEKLTDIRVRFVVGLRVDVNGELLVELAVMRIMQPLRLVRPRQLLAAPSQLLAAPSQLPLRRLRRVLRVKTATAQIAIVSNRRLCLNK